MNYRLSILAALLLLVGCYKDPNLESCALGQSNELTLSIRSYSDKTVASTRADFDDTQIYRGYIFFFDRVTDAYIGHLAVDRSSITQSGSNVTVNVGAFDIKDKIIAVFNYDESAALPPNFDSATREALGEYFLICDKYLSKIENEMNAQELTLGMPMYVNDFLDSDRSVREVRRSLARMELFIKDGLTIDHDSHSHTIGADYLEYAVVNDIHNGCVADDTTHEVEGESCFDVADFNSKFEFPHNLTGYTTTYADHSADVLNMVYLNPFDYATMAINGDELDGTEFDERRLAVIIRHSDTNIYTESPTATYRYYKLNLVDKATGKYYDIKSNHSYRVVITAVNSRGYETMKEAYEMPPSNIEYEIYDDQGGLTYSNGQYAISMDEILSYDEVLVYGSQKTKVEFNNIRYVLPADGQMDAAAFDTNEVKFSVLSHSDGLLVDSQSDFVFDSNDKSVLTDEGQSISLTLDGEGECTIALRIKLGNLEMGRDNITIKKVATNGGGDGAFDAHPGQLKLFDGPYVEGTWQSDDLDFEARSMLAHVEGERVGEGVVLCIGENATPTGYRTMDGNISGSNTLNSYPVFSAKTRRGYYTYKRKSDGEHRKVMVQLEQLPPFYLGHFGSTSAEGSLYHYNGLICERIEEIPYTDDSNVYHQTGGVMMWSESTGSYYGDGNIYSDLGFGFRYHNLVDGLKINNHIINNNKTAGSLPSASLYCYMKNDRDGNGVVDDDEPVRWYLPAQNQVLAMWINKNVFNNDIEAHRLQDSQGDARTYYWSCSEIDPNGTQWTAPSNFSMNAISINMLEGETQITSPKSAEDKSQQNHIRCVRGVD